MEQDKRWVVWGFAAFILLLLLLAATSVYGGPRLAPTRNPGSPAITPMGPPVGTVFVTKNAGGPENNPSPGEWNHCALMGPSGWVLEAQLKGVHAVPFPVFYRRYPEIIAFQVVPEQLGMPLGVAAVAQLGQPYKRMGNNCVTMVRQAALLVADNKPAWRKPDHVLAGSIKVLWHKRQYRAWIESPSPWQGATQDIRRMLSTRAGGVK